MERIFNYKRIINRHRNTKRSIDLGNAGTFYEIQFTNCDPPEEELIHKTPFQSFHVILSARREKTFTAFRSTVEPETLLIVWREFPFYIEIEEGGDIMLQVLHDDRRVRHLIIDNTYVRSGWMNDHHVLNYLENAWFPGLIELELKGFYHLQSKNVLGEKSFNEFGKFMADNFDKVAQKLNKTPFQYFPIETSEIKDDGTIDHDLRSMAFNQSHNIITSLKT